ncbi:hypothetical protein ABDK00_015895 [Niabella insulamsoli]|uniref:hypothetical protein n=1 Tax=Niabella insulamsoli TaxID=3144874 RepID=UPI0031FBCBC4
MKNCMLVLIIGIFICSCANQKRIAHAKSSVESSKKIISESATTLEAIGEKIEQKKQGESVDSSIHNKFEDVLNALKKNLEEAGKSVKAVEFFLEKRSNFNKSKYNEALKSHLQQLDSFKLSEARRDRIYELLSEAVKAKSFEKYGLGAFFDPGVYEISPSASKLVARSFAPAIDSMAALSNRFADVKRGVQLVIVGYADASPIGRGTALYAKLKNYLKLENPGKEKLNMALSDLRAASLLSNLENIMKTYASKFANYDQLTIGSVSYGRGEAVPFKNITDYSDNDERRRVVVFYWAILPDLEGLN